MAARRQDIAYQQIAVRNLKATLAKVEKAREATEEFERTYFLVKRTYASTLIEELGRAAKAAGIHEREKSFTAEAIEGADDLQLLTISASYEGNYSDLVQFVNHIDKSDRLIIIDALQAQPQQAGQGLGIQLKLNAILREDGSIATREVAAR
jgi:Tfp pilus assembly protein PilO